MNSKPILDLSGCSIRCINPLFAAALGGIRILNISNNNLETIPAELAMLPSLEQVIFDRNPLSAVPAANRVSWPKLKAYLKQLNSRASMWLERKLVIVGEENAGKSVWTQELGHGCMSTF
jgi:Leucine-rich repeat (LRR) protein